MRFRLEWALSLAKSRSRGWVQIKCYPAGQQLENCWRAGEHCCRAVTYESGKIRRENSAGKLVAARTKSLFLQFWLLFSSKNKNGAPRETLCPSYRLKMKLENSLYKKTPKALNMPQGLLYVCISTLILVINLFCFNNCGLFCLCYITEHVMTVPSRNKIDVSLVSSH